MSCGSAKTPGSGTRTNISERRGRPVKTRQKISGLLTSENITQDRLAIRSYIDTARKHGCNVMDVLRSAMTLMTSAPSEAIRQVQ